MGETSIQMEVETDFFFSIWLLVNRGIFGVSLGLPNSKWISVPRRGKKNLQAAGLCDHHTPTSVL